MKSFINLAVCGLLAFAVQANAASVQLATNAADAIAASPTATKWAAEQLGVKAGASVAELNAAIAKRSPSEQSAVINAINAFAGKAVLGSDTRVVRKNENLAKTLFTTSTGQTLAVASMVNNAAGKENITNAAAGSCSPDEIAGKIYNKIAKIAPDVTLDDVKNNIKLGYNSLGNCGRLLTDLKPEPLANETRITKVERDCLSNQRPNGHPKRTECLIKANREVLGLTEEAARENQKALEACGYNI